MSTNIEPKNSMEDSAIEVDEDTTPPPRQTFQRKSSFFDRFFHRKSPSPMQSSNASQETLPPLPPVNLIGYTRRTKHKLLDDELAINIRDLLPPRLQLYDDWELVYSNEKDGASLNTLYRHSDYKYQLKKDSKESGYADDTVNRMLGLNSKIEPKRLNGYVLIIRDEDNDRFGAFLNENLKCMDNKRYYGNGETFLWKCERFVGRTHITAKATAEKAEDGNAKERACSALENDNEKALADEVDQIDHQIRFKAFKYTGVNDNIIYSNSSFIAIGSSNGQNGLYIDKSLNSGVSYRCDTFGNEVLNARGEGVKLGKFDILNLEVWRVGDLD